jgi:hypothetical protein
MTRGRDQKSGSVGSVGSAALLADVREVFSRYPEMRDLDAWEMQSALFVLGYTNELEDEGEIAAAIEVARTDWTGRAA